MNKGWIIAFTDIVSAAKSQQTKQNPSIMTLDTGCCYCKQSLYCEVWEGGSRHIMWLRLFPVKIQLQWSCGTHTELHSCHFPHRSDPSTLKPLYSTCLFAKKTQASWQEVRARSGMKSTRTRGKLSPRNTRTRRINAQGAAVPNAACGQGTVWWAGSVAGHFRSPASSPGVECASACGCVSLNFRSKQLKCLYNYLTVTNVKIISCLEEYEFM